MVLVFDGAVRPESVHYQIIPEVKGELRWNDERTVAIFEHDRFMVDQPYVFSLLAARDDAGNRLKASVQEKFVAGETWYQFMSLIFMQ